MKKQVRILLVEDEVFIALMLKKQLENLQYIVSDSVTTGEKAILCAKQNPPDVILMDIRLAGKIDGIEAASLIKANADIPVIFYTGYEDQSIRERAEKLHPIAYLIKPYNINFLSSFLDSYFK